MNKSIMGKLRAFARRVGVDIVEFVTMHDGYNCARVQGYNIECAIIYYDEQDDCVYWY